MKKYTMISLFLGIATNFSAYGNQNSTHEDAILDRLEKRLMEQQASDLNLPFKHQKNGTKYEKKASKAFQLAPIEVSSPASDQDEMQEIENELRQLEEQTEALSDAIEKQKSQILQKSQNDNYIEISIEPEKPKEIAIRDMEVVMNDFRLYQTKNEDNAIGIKPRLLVYLGPIAAGKHTLLLKGRTVRKYSENLPLDMNLYHNYNQTLTVKVPEGPYRKGIRIKLSTPEKQNIHATATMETYEIP